MLEDILSPEAAALDSGGLPFSLESLLLEGLLGRIAQGGTKKKQNALASSDRPAIPQRC
jgi:hypothetical protein